MTAPTLGVKPVSEATLNQVLPLIKKYQAFYRAYPNAGKTKKFFLQLILNRGKGILLAVFNAEGLALGFATLYFLPSSLSAQTTCVLNDLYTIPTQRRKGAAKALLHACRQYALAKGFKQLEWHTQASNKTAQKLYARMPAARSGWYHYSMMLE
jgi:GNAT superfamily N-acetyltransferase